MQESEAFILEIVVKCIEQRDFGAGDGVENRKLLELSARVEKELAGAHIAVDDASLAIGDEGGVVNALEELLKLGVGSLHRAGPAEFGAGGADAYFAGIYLRRLLLGISQQVRRNVDPHR